MKDLTNERYLGLVEQIDFYSWVYFDNKILSKIQKNDLLRIKNSIIVFGSKAKKWIKIIDNILNK